MTDAQWYWEFIALREKEKEEVTRTFESIKAIHGMMVNVLGLNLLNDKDDENEDDENLTNFIPFSLMVSRPEVIEVIMKKMESQGAEMKAMEDDAFEELSRSIAEADDLGDMEPMFEVTPEMEQNLNQWFTPGREQELQALGINVKEQPNFVKGSHHVVDVNPNEAAMQRTKERVQVNKEIQDALKEENAKLSERGVQVVTFDRDG